MKEKNKIYLSLDDLNKIYGISKNVIDAIKKKRKKRRNKKVKKINNGTMGNKPSPSDHMVGSSSALAIATQQLNKAAIDKRIADINSNNLMLENQKKEPLPIELQIYNKLKNKELLSQDELIQYQNIQNTLLPPQPQIKKKKDITRRKTFEIKSNPLSNPLSNVTSNIMGRNVSFNNIKISDDDNTTNAVGTSSDDFIDANVDEFLPDIKEESPDLQIDDPNDYFIDDPPEESPDLQIDDPNNNFIDPDDLPELDTIGETTNEYKSQNEFTIKELAKLAKNQSVPLRKNIPKKELYEYLLSLQLIPKKINKKK